MRITLFIRAINKIKLCIYPWIDGMQYFMLPKFNYSITAEQSSDNSDHWIRL